MIVVHDWVHNDSMRPLHLLLSNKVLLCRILDGKLAEAKQKKATLKARALSAQVSSPQA